MTREEIEDRRSELERELRKLNIAEQQLLGKNIKTRVDFDQLDQLERMEFMRAGGKVVD